MTRGVNFILQALFHIIGECILSLQTRLEYFCLFYFYFDRYFISHLLQFEFYKKLCDLSGHSGPLHNCDFYGSKTAGREFKYSFKSLSYIRIINSGFINSV